MSTSAFLLLSLANTTLRTPSSTHTGTLECLSLALPSSAPAAQSEAYLVLRLGAFEAPIDPARAITLALGPSGARIYTFAGAQDDPPALVLAVPADPAAAEDLQTFDGILAQYGDFRRPASPDAARDLRGRLVLVEQESGEVVGVEERFGVVEDPAIAQAAHGHAPVVVAIPQQAAGDALQLFVRTVPPGEQDWITRSAATASLAISSTADRLLTSITAASAHALAQPTPGPPPRTLMFITSGRGGTRRGLAGVHAVSGNAVKVSAATVALVDRMNSLAVGEKPKPSQNDLAPSANERQLSPSPLSTKKRLLLSVDLVLSTLGQSGKQVLSVGGEQLDAVVRHKYGADAADTALLVGGTVRNVALAYIDMQGIRREALLVRAGLAFVKARL